MHVHAISGRLQHARYLGAVADGLPFSRDRQFKNETRLQVGLIETRECKMGSRRDEQGIHEVGVAIERRIACAESNLDEVFTRSQFLGWNDDVPIDGPEARGPSADRNRTDKICTWFEIENQRLRGVFQSEANHGTAGNGIGHRCRNLK
jgi:hypothetical protein